MAIDTAAKRRSVSTVIAALLVASVTPDATKAVAWRQDAGWGYSGIASTEAAVSQQVTAKTIRASYRPLMAYSTFRPLVGRTEFEPRVQDGF